MRPQGASGLGPEFAISRSFSKPASPLKRALRFGELQLWDIRRSAHPESLPVVAGPPASLATWCTMCGLVGGMSRSSVSFVIGATVAMTAPVTARKAGREGACGDQKYRELLHRFSPSRSSQPATLAGLFFFLDSSRRRY